MSQIYTSEPDHELLAEIIFDQGRSAAIEHLARESQDVIRKKGQKITGDLKVLIRQDAAAIVKNICSGVRRRLLKTELNELLDAKDKDEAIRIAEGSLTLTTKEFAAFALNADPCGFDYAKKHPQFHGPEIKDFDHTKFGETDSTGKFTKQGKKAINLIMQAFQTRRLRSVHLFQDGPTWHCFFFDQRDLTEGHWKAQKGHPHIHYTSHLWGLNVEAVWNATDSRKFSVSKAHIKFLM